jgi:DNA-binding CsgD family transcriptional regulator
MIETRHERRCLEVLHATSVRDFTRQIVSFTQDLGFETVGAMVVTRHSPTLTEFQTVTNAPAAFLNEFHDQEHARLDPVNKHCAHFSSPIVWDRSTYASSDTERLWELQEPFGYRSGMAVAMHLRRGRHFMFGANWKRDRCGAVRNFKSIAEDLLSFAEHAQAAAFELCQPVRFDTETPFSLTARELETLRWSMDGLTSWEVADRMSISERHATLLVRLAIEKLGCSSKYEASLRAIRLGLIECR